MSVEQHRQAVPDEPLRFGVLSVSTTRSRAQDGSGDLLVERTEAAGHVVVARRLVTDDVEAIRAGLRELRVASVQVVLITGGTGLSSRDVTPEAIEPLYGRSIPGFGELFRMLSFEEVGPAAMLSRASAGVIQGVLVFALPGSTRACALAVDRLVLPEVRHMVAQLRKEISSLVPDAVPPSLGTRVALESQRPVERPPVQGGEPGRWQRAIEGMGATVEPGPPPPLPEAVARLAPVTSVLDSAGERATLVLEAGRRLGLYGWPDLQRAGAKVIAVGEGGPLCEVIALHRHPAPTGTCVHGGVLPNPGGSLATAKAITGREPMTDDPMFAVDQDRVWLRRGERAIRWDGSTERDDGTTRQVLATLLTEWHQR